METKKKPKARIYTVFYTVFVLFMLAIIVTVAVIGLRETASNTYHYNETRESIATLNNWQILFEDTRAFSRDLIIYAGNSERTDRIKSKMPSYLSGLDDWLKGYYQYVTNEQEMKIVQELSQLTTQYRDYIEHMVGLSISGEVETMKALLLENEPLIDKISADYQMLYDYNQAMTQGFVWQIENVTNTIIITLISVAVVAFILIIIASVVLIIITNPAELREKETGYEYRYKSDYTQADGLTQTELQQCLADLKAVTNELSQALKER